MARKPKGAMQGTAITSGDLPASKKRRKQPRDAPAEGKTATKKGAAARKRKAESLPEGDLYRSDRAALRATDAHRRRAAAAHRGSPAPHAERRALWRVGAKRAPRQRRRHRARRDSPRRRVCQRRVGLAHRHRMRSARRRRRRSRGARRRGEQTSTPLTSRTPRPSSLPPPSPTRAATSSPSQETTLAAATRATRRASPRTPTTTSPSP